MKIAIIPARGGSKRIKNKNIKEFHGKPIIAWSIETALKSKCFDKIIVSTDSEKIKKIAEKYGAEIPFLRPKNLSDDYTPTAPVISHSIKYLEKKGCSIDFACCIYPTAPFLKAEYLLKGLEHIIKNNVQYVFSATNYNFPIQRSFFINKNKKIEMFFPNKYLTRSQDLIKCFHDAGQFYWGKKESWIDNTPLFSGDSFPIILPNYLVQDIDTIEDWQRAEKIFQHYYK